MLLGPWTARQCCLAIGTAYPLYKSSRALRRGDAPELLQWLTFWTVSALLWVLESIGDAVIGWLPLYYEAKIVLLLWLVLPQYRGAKLLLEQYITPAFVKHEDVIDGAILDWKKRASAKVTEICRETAYEALRRGSGVVAQSQQYLATQLVQQALGKIEPPLQAAPIEHSQAKQSRIASALSSWWPVARKASTPQSPSSGNPTAQPKTTRLAPCDEEKTTSSDEPRLADRPRSEIAPPPPPPSRVLQSDSASTSREEKSKELVANFTKMLIKGFLLVYMPSEGVSKQRIMRLPHAHSRYLIFESARVKETAQATPDSKSSETKRSVKLLLYNVHRIAAGTGSDAIARDGSIDDSRAFILDNGKSVMLFEADSRKTRDLLVAGMRLLLHEYKRQDQLALDALTRWIHRYQQRRAWSRLRISA